MGFPFGQDINYQFFPLVNNEKAINIPTDNPKIYYFQNQPTRAAALAGMGAINPDAGITTWTEIANQYGFWFTIPAIADPDPSSNIDRRTYWLGINFKLKTGGGEPFQTVIRALELERATGHHTQFLVTAQDVLQFFPQVESYYTPTQINAAFWVVKEEIVAYLTNKGFEWCQVWDPKRVQTAAIFKLLMRLMEGQRKIPGDNWDKNHEEYKSAYQNIISSLKLAYDSSRTGEATEVKKSGGFAWVMT